MSDDIANAHPDGSGPGDVRLPLRRSPGWESDQPFGVTILAVVVVLAWILGDLLGISRLVLALGISALWVNVFPFGTRTSAIMSSAARFPLRIGIVLLGFRLSLDAVADVGIPGLAVVGVTFMTALIGGMFLGRRAELSRPVSVLMTIGFAICGQSAVAAAAPLSGADEDEITYAVGLVAVFGAVAIVFLPLLNQVLGFDAGAFGALVGASVHDTSQVLATASVGGEESLEIAAIIKLTRVMLLGPALIWVAATSRRASGRPTVKQFLPWYVAGFIGAVVIRSLNILPEGMLSRVKIAEALALTIAMAGVGASVRLSSLVKLGGKPLVAAAALWTMILVAAASTIWAVGL